MIGWFFRWRAGRQPFPEAWRSLLAEHVPFYPRLAPDARERFETKLKIFARTKHFIPAKDMQIDDTVIVTISAAAARLVMNLPGEHYPKLTEIVVYKGHYQHKEKSGVVFGEAHTWGTVVLSYDAVLAGLRNAEDGHDTALHEFAHVLDIQDGAFDGTPILDQLAAYSPWSRVMGDAFAKLRSKDERRAVLRRYGATNEAEFFAVATEAFFEKPAQMQKRHPELYALLAEYYRIDPALELGA